MHRTSTRFLKFVLIVMALIGVAIAAFLPFFWMGGSAQFPGESHLLLAVVIGLYISAIPFYMTLWQTWKLLTYIDKNTAFSELSVKALRTIKHCAGVMSVIYFIHVPLLLPIAGKMDAPGLPGMSVMFACTPLVIAVFATVLEKLLRSAIDMKSENELTV